MTLTRLVRLLAVLVLVALSLFWSAYASNGTLRRELATKGAAVPVPPIVNGLKLEPAGTEVVTEWPRTPMSDLHPGRTLVLVSADSCAACATELQRWERFLSETGFRETDLVILVSYVGIQIPDSLARVLRSQGASFKVLRVVGRATFNRAMAVKSTPRTLVLDREFRVRFSSGALDGHTSEVLARSWDRLRESAASEGPSD